MKIKSIKKTNWENSGNKKCRNLNRNHSRGKLHWQNTREEKNLKHWIYNRELDIMIKENVKSEKILTQNIQKICNTMKKLNLKIIRVEKKRRNHLKSLVNIFNKKQKTFLTWRKGAYKGTRNMQSTKWVGPEKKVSIGS